MEKSSEFVSIDETLRSIVRSIGVGGDLVDVQRRELRERTVWSNAASVLYAKLRLAMASCPRWFVWDNEIRQWLDAPAAFDGGMKILRHVAGWNRRAAEQHLKDVDEWSAIFNAALAGNLPSEFNGKKTTKIDKKLPEKTRRELAKRQADEVFLPTINVDAGKYTSEQEFFGKDWIGFERAELATFLDAHDIKHDVRAHVVGVVDNDTRVDQIELNSERVDAQAGRARPAEPTDAMHQAAEEAANLPVPQGQTAQTQSLTTGEVAKVFDGIHFDFDGWTRNLEDVSTGSWLERCRVAKGTKGSRGMQARWNPIAIAETLVTSKRLRGKGQSEERRRELLEQKFKTEDLLKPWKSAWDDFTSMMFDNA